MKKVILVTGEKYSGKTTLSKQLAEKLDGSVYFTNFADPIKEIVTAVTNLTAEDIETLKEHEGIVLFGGKTMRQYLQHLGDIMRKLFGKDIFSKKAVERIKEQSVDYAIIGDLRYKLEQDYITDAFGKYNVIVVKVQRGKPTTSIKDEHSSENDFKNLTPDYVLNNTGSLEEFENTANTLCKEINNAT